MSEKMLSAGALMVAPRWTRKASGFLMARISTIATASAITAAMMAMTSNIAVSVISFEDPLRRQVGGGRTSAPEWQQRAQVPVAQPQSAPHHQPKIESQQQVP